MKTDLLVLGDINIDILGVIDAMPPLGGCAFGTTPSMHLGGAGLNTAFAAHKLGLRTTFVSKIGRDFWGDWAIKAIAEHGLDVAKIVRSEKWPTGTVFTALIQGERTFFAFRKTAADNHVLPSDIEDMHLECGNVFLSGTVVFESDESFATYMKLIENLHAGGARVFFDPNVRPNNSISSARVERVLRSTDVFLPSEAELGIVFGGSSENMIIESILARGVKEIWIKRGARGAELATGEGRIAFPPAKAVVIDTTGAGDAFDGCIIWAYQKGFPHSKIGKYANAYAGLSTEKIGAGEIYPSMAQFLNSSQYLKVEKEREDS